MDVVVQGREVLAATLAQAAVDLGNGIDGADAEVAKTIAAATPARTPRRTGALASTVRASGPSITAGSAVVDYAPAVHYGVPSRGVPARPFITDTATQTEPRWRAVAEHALTRILSKIKGA